MTIHELGLLIFSKVFLFMGIGAVLAAVGIFSERVIQFILKQLVVRLLLPLLIFEKVVAQLDFSDASGVAFCFAGALVQIFASTLLVRLLRPLLFRKTEIPGTIVFANSFHNYGFMVYPVVLALYGEKALSLAFVFALTCDGLFWSFGVLLLRSEGGVRWKEILNPPFVVLLVSITLAFFGFRAVLPADGLSWLEPLTGITIPLALTAIGGVFFHSIAAIPRASPGALYPRELLTSLGLRTFFFPLLWIGLILMLPAPSPAREVALIEAIMPASIGIVLLVTLYGGNRTFTVLFSSLSNALSMITIPLYLAMIDLFRAA